MSDPSPQTQPTRISYVKDISEDEVSIEVKGLVAELQRVLVEASTLAQSGQWDFDQCREVCRIAVALSKHNIDAALEALDAVDVIELLYLPNLKGGASYPKGGGQPFEWSWHVGNDYFAALADVVRASIAQDDSIIQSAVNKFLHEAKLKYSILEFGGLHVVRKSVVSLVRDLKDAGYDVASEQSKEAFSPKATNSQVDTNSKETRKMNTFEIKGRKISLVTDLIWTETAMGMIYRYDDIPNVKLDAVSCTAVFRGLDITRAIAKRFNLPEKEFVRAGEICNQRIEVCALEHNPFLILTPRVALQEKYSSEEARLEMLEILEACRLKNAQTLRLCHFAMMTSEDALQHLPGLRNAIREWSHENPAHIYLDVPQRYAARIGSILTEMEQ